MDSVNIWPWLALAGLGLFHGINPAMGWLFAVALGLQRGSQRVVLLSLLPIALGHAAAVASVLVVALALGAAVDHTVLVRSAGIALIAWALWHALYGHRQRVRFGMQVGLVGLAAWSFLMASGHGAGLMLIPALAPICSASSATAGALAPSAIAALGVHSVAMLLTIGVVSAAVYRWIGVDFLRRGWINLDMVWVTALAICGAVLIMS